MPMLSATHTRIFHHLPPSSTCCSLHQVRNDTTLQWRLNFARWILELEPLVERLGVPTSAGEQLGDSDTWVHVFRVYEDLDGQPDDPRDQPPPPPPPGKTSSGDRHADGAAGAPGRSSAPAEPAPVPTGFTPAKSTGASPSRTGASHSSDATAPLRMDELMPQWAQQGGGPSSAAAPAPPNDAQSAQATSMPPGGPPSAASNRSKAGGRPPSSRNQGRFWKRPAPNAGGGALGHVTEDAVEA